LPANVSLHLCRRHRRKFNVFCKSSAFPLGGVSSLDRFCFLSEMEKGPPEPFYSHDPVVRAIEGTREAIQKLLRENTK